MPKKKKEEQQAGKNVLTNNEARKKLKTGLVTITQYMEQIDMHKESIKETIGDLSGEFSLEKKHVKRLATTMFKHNYASLQEENRHFETLYELIVEGQLRDDEPSPDDDEPSVVA